MRCANCDSEVIGRQATALYCSERCRHTAHERRRTARLRREMKHRQETASDDPLPRHPDQPA